MGVVSLSDFHPHHAAGESRTLLRFITCGSVDDGKSTLIGRLLYESRTVFDDQLSSAARDSRRYGTVGEDVDLALLVDGLEAEREQGITIDVAYRFFMTPRRAFIVADTPGHEQFTRNMATGASTADLAILLVDARKGLLPQTKRHSIIASLLGIRSVVLAVNKMDLVDFSAATFEAIASEYVAFAKNLGFQQITPIPLSARFGDNVIERSESTPWYEGRTLLDHLETVTPKSDMVEQPLRFPVQWVNRPDQDFRGFAGTVASGRVAVGDAVMVAGSGRATSVRSIVTFDGERSVARAGEAVTLVLADEVDIARGDVLVPPQQPPQVSEAFLADLIWMDAREMRPGRSYLLRLGTLTVPAQISAVEHRLDVDTLDRRPAGTLGLNDIGLCQVTSALPLAFDAYRDNRRTGAFILIDRASNATVAAGMVRDGWRGQRGGVGRVDKTARARALLQTPMAVWLTGPSAAAASTVAGLVENALHARGLHTMMLESGQLNRPAEAARLLVEAGLIVVCGLGSPTGEERRRIFGGTGRGESVEIRIGPVASDDAPDLHIGGDVDEERTALLIVEEILRRQG
jgi:bifunctional enzyme CysN/CysC